MRNMSWLSKARACALIGVLSIGLSGCFDLTQKVQIDRSGAGHYQVQLTAAGLVGAGLKQKPMMVGRDSHAVTVTHEQNGLVTQTSTIAFDNLSGLKLSDEAMSLKVLGHSFFGLGPAHVRFRRSFLIDHARENNADRMGGQGDTGKQILATVFGDHRYTFAVTLPGSITHIAPVKIGNVTITPTVTGDFYHGHTVTWTMPLALVAGEKSLTFEVDFSAYGTFADSQTGDADESSL